MADMSVEDVELLEEELLKEVTKRCGNDTKTLLCMKRIVNGKLSRVRQWLRAMEYLEKANDKN